MALCLLHYAFFCDKNGQKYFSKFKTLSNKQKKYEYFLVLNLYEISSVIINGSFFIFYFLTKHWIINDIIGFCLAFTTLTLSFIIRKSFMLCFVCLFTFFAYDTFWVF